MSKLKMIKLLTGIEIVGETIIRGEQVRIIKPMRIVDLPQLDLYFARVSPYNLKDEVDISFTHILFGPVDVLPEVEKLYHNWDRYYIEFAKSMTYVLEKTNERMEKSLLVEKNIKEGVEPAEDESIQTNFIGDELTDDDLNDILKSFKPTNKKNAN